MKNINQVKRTPVVASPNINISYQQSKKAASVMKKIQTYKTQEIEKTSNGITKILVAIDGSKKSDEALIFAVNLGQSINAELELLTVTQNLILPWFTTYEAPAPMSPSYLNDFYADHRKYSEEIVENAMKKVKEVAPELKASKKVVRGTPAQAIVEEAKNGFDLIIVGSRGHGFLDELVLGSVSKSVVDNSLIPVIVVK